MGNVIANFEIMVLRGRLAKTERLLAEALRRLAETDKLHDTNAPISYPESNVREFEKCRYKPRPQQFYRGLLLNHFTTFKYLSSSDKIDAVGESIIEQGREQRLRGHPSLLDKAYVQGRLQLILQLGVPGAARKERAADEVEASSREEAEHTAAEEAERAAADEAERAAAEEAERAAADEAEEAEARRREEAERAAAEEAERAAAEEAEARRREEAERAAAEEMRRALEERPVVEVLARHVVRHVAARHVDYCHGGGRCGCRCTAEELKGMIEGEGDWKRTPQSDDLLRNTIGEDDRRGEWEALDLGMSLEQAKQMVLRFQLCWSDEWHPQYRKALLLLHFLKCRGRNPPGCVVPRGVCIPYVLFTNILYTVLSEQPPLIGGPVYQGMRQLVHSLHGIDKPWSAVFARRPKNDGEASMHGAVAEDWSDDAPWVRQRADGMMQLYVRGEWLDTERAVGKPWTAITEPSPPVDMTIEQYDHYVQVFLQAGGRPPADDAERQRWVDYAMAHTDKLAYRQTTEPSTGAVTNHAKAARRQVREIEEVLGIVPQETLDVPTAKRRVGVGGVRLVDRPELKVPMGEGEGLSEAVLLKRISIMADKLDAVHSFGAIKTPEMQERADLFHSMMVNLLEGLILLWLPGELERLSGRGNTDMGSLKRRSIVEVGMHRGKQLQEVFWEREKGNPTQKWAQSQHYSAEPTLVAVTAHAFFRGMEKNRRPGWKHLLKIEAAQGDAQAEQQG